MHMHTTMRIPKQPRRSLRAEARALVETCAGWNSRLAARRITLFLDRELAGLGLTVAQLGLMAQIAVMPDDTLGALANRAGLEQSTLSRNLRTLEADGLIEIAMRRSRSASPGSMVDRDRHAPAGGRNPDLATGKCQTFRVVCRRRWLASLRTPPTRSHTAETTTERSNDVT